MLIRNLTVLVCAGCLLTTLARSKNMKRIGITLWLVVFPAIATLSFATRAAAQTVVVGTGNPDIDVPAVQAAVDQGGDVMLKGHFSFDRPPTMSMDPVLPGQLAMVLVSKEVTVSGVRDDDEGEMVSIDAGTFPFFVNAPGSRVAIQGLRFVRPKGDAIFVYAVTGLVIASCRIEGVELLPTWGREAIDIITVQNGNQPSPTNPGHPENISGRLLIVNNDIDVGGTALENTLGLVVFSVGQSPDKEVDIDVSGNTIRNTTEPAMDFQRVGGRAYIERNVITTGPVAGSRPNVRPQ